MGIRPALVGMTLDSRKVLPLLALCISLPACIPYIGFLLDGSAAGVSGPGWQPRLLEALLSSSLLAVTGAVAATLAAATALPLLLQPRGRRILAFSLALVFCLSPVLLLQGFRLLPGFGVLPPFHAAVLVMTWKMVPVAMAMLLLGVLALGRGELEAGLLSAPVGTLVRRLVIPRLWPSVLASLMVCFVLIFMDGELPGLVGYRNLPEEILARITIAGTGSGVWLLSLPFYMVALLGASALMLCAGGLRVDSSWRRADLAVWQEIAQGLSGTTLHGLGLAVLFLLPVLLLTVSALWGLPRLDLVSGEIRAVFNSAVYGILAALLAACAGYLVAEGLSLMRGRVPRAVVVLLLCGQWLTPGYVLGAGMAEFAIPAAPLLEGDRLLVVTHALRVLPLAVLAFLGFHWMNRRDDPAVELAGIGWWRVFLRLRLPVEWPAWLLVIGVLAALLLSELSSTLLVVAPGTETAVLRIYNLMHYGAGERVSLLALLETLAVLGILFLSTRWTRGLFR